MTDSQKIYFVIKHTKLTASAFSREIGAKTPDIIYHVLRGRNGISAKLADSIIERFPEISKNWLLTGEGSMVKEKPVLINEAVLENKEAQESNLSRALSIIESQNQSLAKLSEATLSFAKSLEQLVRSKENNDQISKAG